MPEQPPGPKRDDASVLRLMAGPITIGFEFLATVLLPGALGYWLDGRFGSRPWLMIVGGVFGFGVGLFRMLKTAAAVNK